MWLHFFLLASALWWPVMSDPVTSNGAASCYDTNATQATGAGKVIGKSLLVLIAQELSWLSWENDIGEILAVLNVRDWSLIFLHLISLNQNHAPWALSNAWSLRFAVGKEHSRGRFFDTKLANWWPELPSCLLLTRWSHGESLLCIESTNHRQYHLEKLIIQHRDSVHHILTQMAENGVMQIDDTLFQSLQHHYTFHCK